MASPRSDFFESYPDMICAVNLGGVMTELNSNWESATGWSSATLTSQLLSGIIHPDDTADFCAQFAKAKLTRLRTYAECRVSHKNGSYLYVFFSLLAKAGSKEVIISAREKTAYQDGNTSLIKSKQQLEAIFSSMREGVAVQAATGEMVQCNPRALEIVGVTADELMGKSPSDPRWRAIEVDGTTQENERHPAAVALKTGKPQLDYPMGFHRSDGSVRWIRLSAIPIFDIGQKIPYQVVMTFSDVTEERNARTRLETKEHELSRLLNTMPALIAYWGADRKNIFANDRYCAVKCKVPSEIQGLDIEVVIGDVLYLQAKPYVEKALQGIASNFEIQVPYPDGSVHHMVATYLPEVRDGEVVGFFSVSTDISRLKELETERRDFESKFIAASKMSALGEMAAGIAHEINNPLAIINGKTSLLQTRIEAGRYEPGKFVEDLKSITSTVERIAKTVRGLLSFARQSDREAAEPADLRSIVETTLDLCREKLRNRGVELRLDLGQPAEVLCHAHQISQILMNLFNNSNDAIFGIEGSWIDVKIKTDGDIVQVRVSDSGPAIPDDVAEKLMNPFFTTKEIGKGTGLGLSISKGLAESHGGKLYYDRAALNTSFVLELPRWTSARTGLLKQLKAS